MDKFLFDKWQCISGEPAIMKKSLALLEGLDKKDAFKIKEDRLIFKLYIDGKYYFVKKNMPKRLKEIIKEIFRPQSKIEYNAGLLLASVGVPVVNMIGWARNKTISGIITESPGDNAITALEFWNKKALSGKNDKDRFLIALAEFIRVFSTANLIHPDLHFGNLLAIEEGDNIKLVVVDPFGITQYRRKGYDIFKGGFSLLLYGLQWPLTRNEKISLFLDSCLIKHESEFDNIWGKIIRFAINHQIKEWPGGRRRKLFTKSTRATGKIDKPNGNVLFVRKENDGNPLFLENELDTACYLIKEAPDKAKQRWLFSLYLDTLGIDHVKAIAWEKAASGQDIVFCEKRDMFSAYKESEFLKDFLQICESAKIKVKNPSQDILFRGEIPCLKNCDPGYWGIKNI